MAAANQNKNLYLFKLASWLMIAVAIIHIIAFFLAMRQRWSNLELAIWNGMTQIRFIPGSSRSLYDFYVGDGYGIAVIYLALAIVNLILLKFFKRAHLPFPNSIILVNAITSWIIFGMTVAWFPLPPSIFEIFISICFTACYLKQIHHNLIS